MSLYIPKFPFWSAIITQTQGSVSIPAGGTSVVTIQPPADQTWLIDLAFSTGLESTTAGDNYCKVEYFDFDGTTERLHVKHVNAGRSTYKPRSEARPLVISRILTSSLYARIKGTNSIDADTLYYGYSGFKLSQPLWSPERLSNADSKSWKKAKRRRLPTGLEALDKYAYDILGINPDKPNDYDLGIILEEDTPLAIDPATNFPVERLTVVVQAEVLADYIAKFKAKTADPIATGYMKYLKAWKDKGIDLGIQM